MSRAPKNVIFARIRRGAAQSTQVALRTYHGDRNLELRIVRDGENGDVTPTWTVLKFAPSTIDALVAAVIAARHRARREGLL